MRSSDGQDPELRPRTARHTAALSSHRPPANTGPQRHKPRATGGPAVAGSSPVLRPDLLSRERVAWTQRRRSRIVSLIFRRPTPPSGTLRHTHRAGIDRDHGFSV